MFEVLEKKSYLDISFLERESANAFSLKSARELLKLVNQHSKWSKPVVVRSKHPRIFCSGGNLTDYQKLKGKAPGLRVNRQITHALDEFAQWPVVKLALIEGDVFGGGFEWLSRFDFRWSEPWAMFGFWQRRLGLSFGWGGGEAWAKRLSEGQMRSLLLEGRLLSSHEALRLGLIDRVGLGGVEAWAESLAELPLELTNWSVVKERRVFEKLWMGIQHQAILKRWKPRSR